MSAEQPEPERKLSDHTIAVWDADGILHTVRADEMRVCTPTAKCMAFWVQTCTCFICMGVGIFFMLFEGTSSPYFFIGEGLLTLAVGILIPAPKYTNILPKRLSKGEGDV